MKKFLSLLAAGAVAMSLTAVTAAAGTGDCADLVGREKSICLSKFHAPGIKKHIVKQNVKVGTKNNARVSARTLKNNIRKTWKTEKVTICHRGVTLNVAVAAWSAHEKLGATKGACRATRSSSSVSSTGSSSSAASSATSSAASSASSGN